MNGWVVAGTAFVASAVEAVEALTIVLAVGYGRGWRPALAGTGWALLALAAIAAALGPAIGSLVPLGALQIGVGIFLMLFGLAWLRKAILRYAGRKALHDEAAIFARELDQIRGRADERLAFATAFNGVLLEGIEVVAIVITFGASARNGVAWAALGALTAALLVALAGVALRRPFERVPENAMKFVVGIMLASFGTFWSGEGLGIAWWGQDLALLAIVAVYLATSIVAITLARSLGRMTAGTSAPSVSTPTGDAATLARATVAKRDVGSGA